MRVITGAGRYTDPAGGELNHWIEHLRVADLSVGSYSIPRGGTDDQVPHTEDEIYVVTAGRAVLRAGTDSAEVGLGSVVFVAAGEEHRFTDITEDLAAIVVFAPAEGTREEP
ncbi:MAG TPA: cupin domain-containing protein [Streptosporangiaceae bacterium]|nr:cupin domain-containing protein [Streptosporangiaceae bacterium]